MSVVIFLIEGVWSYECVISVYDGSMWLVKSDTRKD